ncbi:group XIIA secretory phospholipase A2-like isoform X2 [Neoarius graeffei]|uniref:group XIIA secretory phospholipase A2-like isoform X2 n=1 Tax=Neoarius graeffei TaxID=443677 RepID=UPI00298C13C8|nr:group XIIA secretory phospholipase A2-like isoform X2 [Neoarius graeffei]
MKQLSVSALLLWGTFLSSAGLVESEYFQLSGSDGVCQFQCPDGSDGVCQFQCPDGGMPFPRPGHNPSHNGCSTPLFGFYFDIGIPSITNCCNQHDRCYDTCGQRKLDCDKQFQVCLKTICWNLLNVLELDQSVQVCESRVSLIFDAVMHLGCRSYLDSQRAACICYNKYRTEL